MSLRSLTCTPQIRGWLRVHLVTLCLLRARGPRAHTGCCCPCASHGPSRPLQIIGRGNDQVAISSKFETREDIGMVPTGVVRVAPKMGGGSVSMSWVMDVVNQSGFTQRSLPVLHATVGWWGPAMDRSLWEPPPSDTSLRWRGGTGGVLVGCALARKAPHLDVTRPFLHWPWQVTWPHLTGGSRGSPRMSLEGELGCV